MSEFQTKCKDQRDEWYDKICHLAYKYETGKTVKEQGFDEEYDSFFQDHPDDEMLDFVQEHNLPLPSGVNGFYCSSNLDVCYNADIEDESEKKRTYAHDCVRFFVLHTDELPPLLVLFHLDELNMAEIFALGDDYTQETVESIIRHKLPDDVVPFFIHRKLPDDVAPTATEPETHTAIFGAPSGQPHGFSSEVLNALGLPVVQHQESQNSAPSSENSK